MNRPDRLTPHDFNALTMKHQEGILGWECPSNIALVKYWGKHPGQIPANPSLSMTLSNCVTQTRVHYDASAQGGLLFRFEGEERPDFASKVQAYLKTVTPDLPWIDSVYLEIDSRNTFPHSSGIASSASSMGALALCLMEVDKILCSRDLTEESFLQKASELARRGSGSACRSLYGGFVLWGQHEALPGSDDRFAVPVPAESICPWFADLQDTVLLVDKGRKSVSSSAGHGLMNGHPYAAARFAQARARIQELLGLLRGGALAAQTGTGFDSGAGPTADSGAGQDADLHALWMALAEVVESEALTLHAMMLCSSPSFLLMKPATLAVLEEIRNFRNQTGIPVFFSLDAGANVHVLYPASVSKQAMELIDQQLSSYLDGGAYLCDRLGTGPVPLQPPPFH
jgi:diphosphomevalonate decarboxylase